MTTTVVNIDLGDEFDICIDRRSVFGNPYRVALGRTREQAVAMHRELLRADRELQGMAIKFLTGKRLGCHCKRPERFVQCHGDNYVDLIEGRL